MPTLHVRNVPETVYARLRERAQTQNRSISAEAPLITADGALMRKCMNIDIDVYARVDI
ncbi:MAG: hypothetical protein KDE48_16735 [Anaerolineales bacterium]|nr:hypothetical protein [Anaerolineales bacterium]